MPGRSHSSPPMPADTVDEDPRHGGDHPRHSHQVGGRLRGGEAVDVIQRAERLPGCHVSDDVEAKPQQGHSDADEAEQRGSSREKGLHRHLRDFLR